MTFRRAALTRWGRLYGANFWGDCEQCGRSIPDTTVPHHVKEAQGGLGGKRKHDPELLRYLCPKCHDKEHGR